MVDETEDRPVLVGVIALVGVSLVVGLIVGVVALGGARVFGLNGGGGGGGGGATVEPTLSLPPVTETSTASGPLITLTPGEEGEEGEEAEGDGGEPTPTEPTTTTTEAAVGEITLQASTTSAGPMERIDVSGIYTGGDGSILTIQRFTDGSWNDIAANAAVSGDLFSTYITLGRPGENRIRVIDPSADVVSNEVVVTIQ